MIKIVPQETSVIREVIFFRSNPLLLLFALFVHVIPVVGQQSSCSSLVADAGADISLCMGTPHALGGAPTASGGSGGYFYSWSPNVNISCRNCPNPVFTGLQSQLYTVNVTDNNGCSTQDIIRVNVLPDSNLVNNASFERGEVPVARGEIGKAENWFAASGTPDLFDSRVACVVPCNNLVPEVLCVGVPCNQVGFEPERSGLGRYIGLRATGGIDALTYADLAGNKVAEDLHFTVEAAETHLRKPLVPGETYDLQFYGSLADQGDVYMDSLRLDSIRVRIKLSQGVQTSDLYQPVNGIVIFSDWITSASGWKEFFHRFTPNQAYDYLTIEVELNKAGVRAALRAYLATTPPDYAVDYYTQEGLWLSSYAYVDDISVRKRCKVPAPIASAGADKNICINSTVTLGDNPTAMSGAAPYQYSWSPANGLMPSANVSNPQVSPASTTTYTVTVTDQNGAQSSDQVTVSVSAPTFDVVDQDLCLGDNVSVGNSGAINGVAPYSYVWTGQTQYLSCINCPNPTFNASVTGNFRLNVSVTDALGCRYSESILIRVNSPTANANIGRRVCANRAFTLGGYPAGTGGFKPLTYQWTPISAFSSVAESQKANPSVSISNDMVFTLTVTDAKGCSDSDQVSYTVTGCSGGSGGPGGGPGGGSTCTYMPPVGKEDTVCLGSSITIGGDAASCSGWSYSWSPTTALSCSTCATTTASPSKTTTYTLLVSFNGNPVSKSVYTIYVVNPPNLNLQDPAPICEGKSVKIGPNPESERTYQWRPTTGLSCEFCAQPQASPNTTTTYSLNVDGLGFCNNANQVTVTVNPKPRADAGPDVLLCGDECATLGGSAVQGSAPLTFKWTPTIGMKSSDVNKQQPDLCWKGISLSGNFPFVQEVTDSKGCVGRDTAVVTARSNFEYVPYGNLDPGPVPQFQGGIEDASGWIRATGTPDLFDPRTGSCALGCPESVLDINCVGVPCNHMGHESHQIGLGNQQRYGGIWSIIGFQQALLKIPALNLDTKVVSISTEGSNGGTVKLGLPVGRQLTDIPTENEVSTAMSFLVEGAEIALNRPLAVGVEYNVSFWVSRAEKGQVDGYIDLDSAAFQVKFSEGVATNTLYRPVPATSTYIGAVKDTAGWTLVNYQFIADRPYNYVTIESLITENMLVRAIRNLAVTSGGVKEVVDRTTSLSFSDLTDEDLRYLTEDFGLESYMYFDGLSVKAFCPKVPSVTISDNDTICKGGCTTVSVSAPQGSSYTWRPTTGVANPNGSSTAVCPGETTTYEVTVEGPNGNIFQKQVTIFVHPTPRVDAGRDFTLCSGDCGTLGASTVVSGGTPPYQFSWSPSGATVANPQICSGSAGIHTVQVTDKNGCTASDHVNVDNQGNTDILVNGDFENGVVPQERAAITDAQGWTASKGTPDLFDRSTNSCDDIVCGTTPDPLDYNCVGVPCNNFGVANHVGSGDRYAGLWSLSEIPDLAIGGLDAVELDRLDASQPAGAAGLTEFTEGVQKPFTQPLKQHEQYRVRFLVSQAEKGELGPDRQHKSAKFVVKLSMVPVSSVNTVRGANSGDVIYSGSTTNHTGWDLVDFTFEACRDYRYLIVESVAQPVNNSASIDVNPPIGARAEVAQVESFMYLDQIRVTKDCFSSASSCSSPIVHETSEVMMRVLQDFDAFGKRDAEYVDSVLNKEITTIEPEKTPGYTLKVYPNPASDKIYVNLENQPLQKELQIQIIDARGRVVYDKSKSGSENLHTLDIKHLASGLYQIWVKDDTDVIISKEKVVISK